MKNLLFLLCVTLSTTAFCQDKSFTLNGGWAVALPNNSDAAVNGFKIGGRWEKISLEDHWGFGVEGDYINFKQIGSKTSTNSVNKFRTIPLAFYAKYLVGNDKLQGYARVGGGFQFTKVSSETPNLYLSDNDFGITLTTGAGGYYVLTEYLSLNLDYQFLYLSNASYNSGIVNSVSLGIRFMLN